MIQNTSAQQTQLMIRDKALWVSILLLFSSIIFFSAPFTPVLGLRKTHLAIIRSFIHDAEPGLFCLSIVLIVGLWFILAKYMIAYAKTENARLVIYCLVALTTLVCIVGSFIGVIFTVGRTISSTELADNRYHLESQSGSEISFYKLFKCDLLDFNCEQVSTISSNNFAIEPNIIANPEANTLSVIVNGETIYTYIPEE